MIIQKSLNKHSKYYLNKKQNSNKFPFNIQLKEFRNFDRDL